MSDDKLLTLLKQAKVPAAGDPGKTVEELAIEIFGDARTDTRNKVRLRLKAAIESGAVVAGRGLRMNIAGNRQGKPVFRLAGKK